MNKKQYIAPVSIIRIPKIDVYMHQATKINADTNTVDTNTDTHGLKGVGLNNYASGTVGFGNERGFDDDSGPWESLW